MTFASAQWFVVVPVAEDKRPFNVQIVTDVGRAYFAFGLAPVWFGASARATGIAFGSTLFIALHAVYYLAKGMWTPKLTYHRPENREHVSRYRPHCRQYLNR